MFSFLLSGGLGEYLAPRPDVKLEFYSLIKAGQTERALLVLQEQEDDEEVVLDLNELEKESGMSALHMACVVGALDLVVEMLTRGANATLTSRDGNNSLHFATINGHRRIIEVLMRSGADPSIPNAAGLLPVELTRSSSIKESLLKDRLAIAQNVLSPMNLIRSRMVQHAGDVEAESTSVSGSHRHEHQHQHQHNQQLHESEEGVISSDSAAGALVMPLLSDSSSDDGNGKSEASGGGGNKHRGLLQVQTTEEEGEEFTLVGVSSPNPQYHKRAVPMLMGSSDGDEAVELMSDEAAAVAAAADRIRFLHHPQDNNANSGSGGATARRESGSSVTNSSSSNSATSTSRPEEGGGPKGGEGGGGGGGGHPIVPKLDLGAIMSANNGPPTAHRLSINSSTTHSSPTLTPTESMSQDYVYLSGGGGGSYSTRRVGGGQGGGGGGGVGGVGGKIPTGGYFPGGGDAEDEAFLERGQLEKEVLAASRNISESHVDGAILNARFQVIIRCVQTFEPAITDVKEAAITNELRKLFERDQTAATFRICSATISRVNYTMGCIGQTPLHIASRNRNIHVVKVLLEQPTVSAWTVDLQGKTPLHSAVEGIQEVPSRSKVTPSLWDKTFAKYEADHKRSEIICKMLREAMLRERPGRDPVGQAAPLDMGGNTPLGWLSRSSKPSEPIKEILFHPGDVSVLPKSPIPPRVVVSPWKIDPARENVVAGFSEASGWNRYMEDRVVVSCPLMSRKAWSFFGVCDGHGGSTCSDYIAKELPKILGCEAYKKEHSMNSSSQPGGLDSDSDTTTQLLFDLLADSCAIVEEDLKNWPSLRVDLEGEEVLTANGQRQHASGRSPGISFMDTSGSTGCFCLATTRLLAFANVGDSRAVMALRHEGVGGGEAGCLRNPFALPSPRAEEGDVSLLEAKRITTDHKLSLAAERERIERAGGLIKVEEGRSDETVTTETCEIGLKDSGSGHSFALSMSRSFGDFHLKQNATLPSNEQVVVAVPDLFVHERSHRDAFVVIATDGVWDVMSDQEVVDFLGKELRFSRYGGPVGGISKEATALACDALLQRCLEKGAHDNMSVVLVVTGGPPSARASISTPAAGAMIGGSGAGSTATTATPSTVTPVLNTLTRVFEAHTSSDGGDVDTTDVNRNLFDD